MFKKIIIISLMLLGLFTTVMEVQAETQIEIFHINKGKVVKEVPVSDVVKQDVKIILEGITDIYREFEPIPKNGHMVKIPLEPAIKLENKWYHDLVSEVILIFPEYENPHIMVFNDENNPFFFTFEASVDGIMDELNLKLKGTPEDK